MSIPVICDRCRTTGGAGDGDFSHLGDLLEFEPVAVRPRANGWDPDAQRAFIALLATTGSKRSSALAIGRNVHGFEQLLKRPDGAGLKLAFERAMAIYQQNGAMKIATGVADAAARNAQMTPPSRLRGLAPPVPEEPTISEEQQLEALDSIARKFIAKVWQERKARLTGRIVEADFYLRQITFIEIALDLGASNLGRSPFEFLGTCRRGDHGLLQIAETPFSRILDERRRQLWEDVGEPERPEHPPLRTLIDHGSHSTNVDTNAYGALTHPAAGYTQEQWAEIGHEEQVQARKAEFEAEAAAQVEWEAKARAEFEASSSSSRT